MTFDAKISIYYFIQWSIKEHFQIENNLMIWL